MALLSKKALLAGGVSILALAISAPAAFAADLPIRPAPQLVTKAPPLPAISPWTWWVEGGAQAVSGADSYIGGLDPPFAAPTKRWGWDAAAGVDYRLDAAWHVSAAFRYGQQGKRTSTNNQKFANTACLTGTPHSGACTAVAVAGSSTATRSEHNWSADFMVGRDIGLGSNSQVKLGLRIAEIRGKTDGNANGAYATFVSGVGTFVVKGSQSYTQTNRFLGAGPRAAIEGSAPLAGGFAFEYMGGVAALYSQRSVNQTVGPLIGSIVPNIPGFSLYCNAGCPGSGAFISDAFVFNADAMLGISYAVTANAKLMANYRVDYYNNALTALNSTGNAVNVSRTYHGPNLRLTVNY